MDEQLLRDQAMRRLKKKRDFTGDVIAYIVVNAFLIALWYFAGGRGYFWPAWVLGGWGIGLAFHAWDVFGRRDITEADVQREMERQRGRGRVYDDSDLRS
jgi:2TM domain